MKGQPRSTQGTDALGISLLASARGDRMSPAAKRALLGAVVTAAGAGAVGAGGTGVASVGKAAVAAVGKWLAVSTAVVVTTVYLVVPPSPGTPNGPALHGSDRTSATTPARMVSDANSTPLAREQPPESTPVPALAAPRAAVDGRPRAAHTSTTRSRTRAAGDAPPTGGGVATPQRELARSETSSYAEDPETAPPPPASDARREGVPEQAASGASRSLLAEERGLIEGARRALAQGRAPDAIALLNEQHRRFQNGSFADESTILRMDAYLAMGRADVARNVAQEMLQANPEGAYAARLRRVIESRAEQRRSIR